ncbi:E3 SUMO-protein ligase PIAS3-like [Ornithodoros turicata]|uniref:E3 SUMO-protein ligase PIAS3-like n=1 Tax=Ornithodoros turicata TaxID=34597 RepID=UPI00313A1983
MQKNSNQGSTALMATSSKGPKDASKAQRDLSPFYTIRRTLDSYMVTRWSKFPVFRNVAVPATQSGKPLPLAEELVFLRTFDIGKADDELFLPISINGIPLPRTVGTVNVTPFLKHGTNRLRIDHYAMSGKGGVLVSIDSVKRATAGELLRAHQLGKKMNSAERSKSLIAETINTSLDSEVSATTAVVSVSCPLSRTRLQVPCRGITCNHLQCFDAICYLKTNETARGPGVWRCPVCYRIVDVTDLEIDQLWVEILKEVPSSCAEVQLYEDGSWTAVDAKEWSVILADDSFVSTAILDETIDLTEDS